MSQPTDKNPQIHGTEIGSWDEPLEQNLRDLVRRRAEEIFRAAGRPSLGQIVADNIEAVPVQASAEERLIATINAAQASFPRTAYQVAEERMREQLAQIQRQTAEVEQAAQAQAGQAALADHEHRAQVNERLARELQGVDIRLDPEINKVAQLFYTALTSRIYFEFGHKNPEWANLGGEKKLWLEAAQIVLEELAKTPVENQGLAAIVNKRIITG